MNDRNTFIGYRWLNGCTLPPVDPVGSVRTNKPDRHSAIWTKLPDWHSYKSWVNKGREGSKRQK